ncbi:MAG: ATP-dependent DNA helicase RecG [Candidatus Moranbacteria bacterium]|nr:ATP-dependent DNA helicase RecG [Candidatus Moranbacteria bacterium]
MINLDTKLEKLPRVQKNYFKKLAKLNLFTVKDLLKHFPSRYEDYSKIFSINQLQPNLESTVIGTIIDIQTIRTYGRKMLLTEALLEDKTGTIKIIWFNQSYIGRSFPINTQVRISGKVNDKNNELSFSAPEIEKANRIPTNTGRLVPIYPETAGLTSKWIRWQIQIILDKKINLPDPIPQSILKELHLPNFKTALRMIHFPKKMNEVILAQKRFAFEEMLILQLTTLKVRLNFSQQKSPEIKFDKKLIQKFIKTLPFAPTDAQRKSSFQILTDLEKSTPMNRLLNGDVGAGKTLVAVIATLQCINENFQVTILAPTEVLASQHFKTFLDFFEKYNFEIGLLTSTYKTYGSHPALTKKTTRPKMLELIKSGKINLIVGTHALIQEDIEFEKLGLVIIDEQHRFGVAQRSAITQKENLSRKEKNLKPHLLTMTATPIPRTFALALFGDLDVSVLDEKPLNRKEIKTKVISPTNQKSIYKFIKKEIEKGQQVYIILPLVEESEAIKKVKAAITEHKRLQSKIFPDLKLGLLHGRLKSKDKENLMTDFKNKKINILVSTSVIEVGVDIPNATLMIIENAERFGLSQLHQFRGRIGRDEHQSYCFLFSENINSERLQAMEKYNDGFKLADIDLKLRGPGEFVGSRQSGLTDGAMKNINNLKLVTLAREKAKEILKNDFELNKSLLLKKIISELKSVTHL